jgi:predicted Zn-dependent protease
MKGGVTREKEPAYVAAFKAVSEAIGKGDLAAARTGLAAFAAAFPEAPGADVLACDLELRARRPAVAVSRCEAAIAKFAEASRAHYLLGVIASRTRQDPKAERHLRRAIAFDPTDPGAWSELAHYYRATRANQRLEDLEAQHRALFSKPLPR